MHVSVDMYEKTDCHLPVVQNNTAHLLYKRYFSAVSLIENILCGKMQVLLQLLALVGCSRTLVKQPSGI